MLIILVIFVLISALVILVTCEFYIVANIGVLLVGLGGSKIFKDYAVNVMRYVLAVAVKLFVLQLVVNIGFAIISLTDLDASVGSTVKSIKFVDLFFLIGKAVILLALAKSLPDTCAGIINGSAIGGGNPIAGMARTAGVMAVGAITSGAGYAVGAAKAGNAAHTIAKDNGAECLVGTAAGMIKAGWQARSDAKAGQVEKELASNPGSVKNQLLAQANAVKAMHLLDDEPGEQTASGGSSAGGSGTAVPTSASAGNSTGSSGVVTPASTPASETGQTASAGNNNSGSATVAPSSAPVGETGHTAPAANNAGGSGAAVPASTSAGNSTGGSGATAPDASTNSGNSSPPDSNPGGSGQAVPPKPSKEDYGPRPQPRGTVDMRTFNPSTLKK